MSQDNHNQHIYDVLLTTKKELNYVVACILQVNAQTASDYTGRVGRALASKAAGAGAAAGVLGLVSAFGTAGTGTAIASLSGAAATNATLAWVGGLIGGGMAAGTFLTGGIALVAGVGAYKLFGSKPREYDTLSDVEKKIVDTCIVLIKSIDEQFQILFQSLFEKLGELDSATKKKYFKSSQSKVQSSAIEFADGSGFLIDEETGILHRVNNRNGSALIVSKPAYESIEELIRYVRLEPSLSLKDVELFNNEAIKPLWRLINDNSEVIASRLDFKNKLAFEVTALTDFKQNVVNAFSYRESFRGLKK